MGLSIFLVDAFTDKPFAGNPAAVCLLSGPCEEPLMQSIAQEMNQCETAFVYKERGGFNLRWFTPIVEVDVCGHATLATAHILWEKGLLGSSEQARFHTKSGLLTAEKKGDWIELDFPADLDEQMAAPPDLISSLKATPTYVGRTQFDYLVEVDSEDTVRGLDPDLDLLATLPVEGVIVTSSATSSDYDFVSRYFAPRIGIDEDAVCGAAHCCLGPFWQARLGKDEFVAYQASARGGVVRVRLSEDRVYLSGHAVIILSGELVSV